MLLDDRKKRREFGQKHEQIKLLPQRAERAKFFLGAALFFDMRIEGLLELHDVLVEAKRFSRVGVFLGQIAGPNEASVPLPALHFLAGGFAPALALGVLRRTLSYHRRWNSFAQLWLTSPPTIECSAPSSIARPM